MMVVNLGKAMFNEGHKDVLDSMLLTNPEVKPGKMFGYPAYYIGGKLFACIYENSIGLKVPETDANEYLKREEVTYFQPLGRKRMREWIQINRKKSDDYLKDKEILASSMQYVASLIGVKIG